MNYNLHADQAQKRSFQGILVVSIDDFNGFPDSINSVYFQPHIQLCIIYLVQNSLRYVLSKDVKALTAAFWDIKYPQIIKS
ncbi:transposase [Morganella morganii]|uniref:transposase n=1 Tax=Morganella morganii TaxID=582 RepID=UPI003F723539